MQAILVKHETFLRYNPIQQILEATLEVKKVSIELIYIWSLLLAKLVKVIFQIKPQNFL